MKQKIIPIASVVIGLAAFFMTVQYFRGKHAELEALRNELRRDARRIEVAAAAHDIPGGTVIKHNDLKLIEVPEMAVSAQVVKRSEGRLILGRKTVFPIRADKPILWSEIEGGAPSERELASLVKVGLRAVSLSVGGASAVSGMVRPSDRVDILGTFSFPSQTRPDTMETVTLTVLQDVTVLATGQTTPKTRVARGAAKRPSGYSTVTVEVTPREAELLVFAQQVRGRLVLSLRNPSDVTYESDLPEINFEHIETKLPELNLYRQRNIRLKRNL